MHSKLTLSVNGWMKVHLMSSLLFSFVRSLKCQRASNGMFSTVSVLGNRQQPTACIRHIDNTLLNLIHTHNGFTATTQVSLC